MSKCVGVISDHFTKMTSVINEGNSYQFPSKELHLAILNRMILKDPDFKKFFIHVKESYLTDKQVIKSNYKEFDNVLRSFIVIVEEDLSKNLTNIEMYMRDLKRHALNEY
mgnify:CR=1 FL=1